MRRRSQLLRENAKSQEVILLQKILRMYSGSESENYKIYESDYGIIITEILNISCQLKWLRQTVQTQIRSEDQTS